MAEVALCPTCFVPRDTTEYTPYLNKVINYGYLYQYAFQFTDVNRSELKRIQNLATNGEIP